MTDQVVVVGASSSGLFAAYLLARQGVPVAVYEQAETLAPPARSLIVTTDLSRALGFVPDDAIIHRVNAFELRTNGTLAHLSLRDPDLIIERATLVRLLAARAEAAGVRIHYGQRFAGLETDGRRTVAKFQARDSDRTERVEARAVVGADGGRSSVARALGQPARPRVTVMQARVALPADADPGVSQVWFAPRDTPYFYWLIPESARTAVVGLVDASARTARPKLDRFLRQRGYEPLAYQGARIAMYRPTPAPIGRLGTADILLVGDAAGQVKVTTVGGTVTGLWGARAAARAIQRGSRYQRELGSLNRELYMHWLIRAVLNRCQDEEYVALLTRMNQRLRAILHVRNRDEMAGGVWPVLAAQPWLLLLGARALTKTLP